MATSNQLIVPAYTHDFLHLIKTKKFLRFSDAIDAANPHGTVDPPTMNKAWFRTVVQLYKQWNGYSSREGRFLSPRQKKDELVAALLQVRGDATQDVEGYWAAKAMRLKMRRLREKCDYPWEDIRRFCHSSSNMLDTAGHKIYGVDGDIEYTHEDLEVPTHALTFDDEGMTGLELYIEQQRLVLLGRQHRKADTEMQGLMEGLATGNRTGSPQKVMTEMERRYKVHGIDENYDDLDK